MNCKRISVEQQLKLVSDNPDAVLYMHLPAKQTFERALIIKPDLINLIDNQTVSLYELRQFLENKRIIEEDPKAICTIDNPSEELCRFTIQQDGRKLHYVPEKYKNREMCEIAVKQNGYALKYVPEQIKDYEMCMMAVEQDGYLLAYVPQNLITYEICKIAVKTYGYALNYIPDKCMTQEICDIALAQNKFASCYLPQRYKQKGEAS